MNKSTTIAKKNGCENKSNTDNNYNFQCEMLYALLELAHIVISVWKLSPLILDNQKQMIIIQSNYQSVNKIVVDFISSLSWGTKWHVKIADHCFVVCGGTR